MSEFETRLVSRDKGEYVIFGPGKDTFQDGKVRDDATSIEILEAVKD